MMRAILIAALILGSFGLAVSLELSRLHYKVNTQPSYESWCKIGETVNCDAVEKSSYAVVAGVPLAAWGVVGYLVLLGVLASGFVTRRNPIWPRGAFLGISLLFCLLSASHGYIAFVLLEVVCLLCTATYVTNFLLLLLAIFWLRRSQQGFVGAVLQDSKALLQAPKNSLPAAASFAAVSALLIFNYPDYWSEKQTQLEGQIRGVGSLPTGTTADGSHWVGAENPTVTIVEFSDYECPYCAKSHSIARQAVEENPKTIRLVHRHYPLDMACNDMLDRPFHRHACIAARAAECAGEQKAFWPMNDLLFAAKQNKKKPTREVIEQFAKQLQLDPTVLATCLGSEDTERVLQRDIAAASALNIEATPSYLINGSMLKGALNPLRLEKILARKQSASQPQSQPTTQQATLPQ